MSTVRTIEPAERGALLPEFPSAQFALAPLQEGMLFHTLLAPSSGVYIEQIIYRLTGRIDVRSFEEAWRALVDRHEILRTAFVWNGMERPTQRVQSSVKLPFYRHDWRRQSQSDQAVQLEAFLEADRQKGFDLARAPLMRVTLIQTGAEEYELIWSSHHMLLDGWSQAILLKEVFQWYQALRSGEAPTLRPVRPYRDFIEWLEVQDFVDAERFWRQTLGGFSEPTALGIEQLTTTSPDSSDFDYQDIEVQLSHETTSALQSYVRHQRLTLYTLIQGAWAILLSRYSHRDDVVFGTTVSTRPPDLSGIENTAGLFINTLPVRTRLQSNQPVLNWLRELQLDTVEAREYQYTPLVNIQRWIDVPRGSSLFNSILVFENFPALEMLGDLANELTITRDRSFLSRTNYPLTILVEPGQRLLLHVVYDGLRFEQPAIKRLLGHLEVILKSMIASSNSTLGEIQLLTQPEQTELLLQRNSTSAEYERNACFHQLFARRAQENPNSIAVIFGNEMLSYAELDARANKLGRFLRGLGLGPESLVGICMDRSLEMVVGLLGIMKAGAAYVPLDPAFPGERLAYMIKDAGVEVLLTQQHLVSELPQHGASTICMDADWKLIERESDEAPAVTVNSENLAYVIYTSGSTGKPKGVAITHRALTNFLFSVTREPGISEDDVLLSVTTLSFDIAALELYLPLLNGARLVVVSRETASDGNLLREALSQSGTTFVQATPATWKMLIDAEWSGSKQLKVLCGGEALSPDLAGQLLERCGSLWNMYGPTETTIWSTAGRVESCTPPISIGKPLANTQVYLLDSNLQPVPLGVVGELHIGGDGLARGYLNQPDLTNQKFINNPFVADPNARIYKTGDLARYLPDGTLECLGRSDDQVKIRGFRIEPGEIETVLKQHHSVSDCIVVAREDVAGDRRLVGYVVPAGARLSTSELSSCLRERLPEYMVPAALVELPQLPLTPNGKVDRRALPAPEFESHLEQSYVRPRTTAEEMLTEIWTEVLKVSRVGINDNFFELGGHSLMAVRLFSQIEKVFGKRLPLATLFQAPTVKELAMVLQREGWIPPWSSLVTIQAGNEPGAKRPLFCVHALGGNVLEFYDLARYLGPDQPFYAFQSLGLDGKQKPLMRVEDMAAHYIKEMRRVQPDGPYLMAGRSFGGTVAFEMACQLRDQGEEVALVALLDTYPVGYFKLQANSGKLSQRMRRFVRRMKCHADNLQKLAMTDKFKYLVDKAQFAPAKVKHGMWQTAARMFERLNRPMPAILRSIEQFNWNAALEYVPRIYDGRIALFWASVDLTTAYDLIDGWQVLAAGGIDIHEIPGSHIDIIKEPHVRVLAAKLSACLEQIPAEDSADDRAA